MTEEDLSDWTVARMEALCTPQQAARIKWQAATLRLCVEPDPHLDELQANDPGHRMFVYCLDAVARRTRCGLSTARGAVPRHD